MATVTFETFDYSAYQRAPRGNVHAIVSLCNALVEGAPKGASEAVDRTSAKLALTTAEVEEGLTTRRRELAPADFSQELELDGFADVMWGALRSGLELWKAFEHPGLTQVVDAQTKKSAAAAALRSGRDKAARARTVAGKLFGSEGLTFTQKSYPEQAVSMASILRLVEQDELGEEIDAVVAPEVQASLHAIQPMYQAMVDGRLNRKERKSGDLAAMRTKLQRAIAQYCTTVLALLDESKPQTLELVVNALAPIDVFRAQNGSGGKKGPAGGGGEDEGGGAGEDGEGGEPSA